MYTTAPLAFYTVDGDDPNPLMDEATLTWQEPCTSGATNCPVGDQFATTGSQSPIVTATPTNTPTATSTPTNTPVPPTPTYTPSPGQDSDGDGCSDAQELSMGFNPNAWYDFYDVPIPAKDDPTPNGSRDKAVNLQDVVGVLKYVGAFDSGPSNGRVDHDSDKNGDTIDDGRDYDRSQGPLPNPPNEAGPPDGAVNLQDVVVVLEQVGLDCSGPP